MQVHSFNREIRTDIQTRAGARDERDNVHCIFIKATEIDQKYFFTSDIVSSSVSIPEPYDRVPKGGKQADYLVGKSRLCPLTCRRQFSRIHMYTHTPVYARSLYCALGQRARPN